MQSGRTTTTPRARRAAVLGAAALLLAACGGGEPAGTGDADPVVEELATGAGETATDDAAGDGRGGGDDDAVPPYDSDNERTVDVEGVPEPCLLLTPALVASIHGPFDQQFLLNGPTCNYISAEPLFDVALHTAPPSLCDQIVDDAGTLGHPVEDETIDGRIVSWLFPNGAGNTLVYDGDWCFHLKVLSTGNDRTTMTRYVEAITDALG